jgi:hypothetical protein
LWLCQKEFQEIFLSDLVRPDEGCELSVGVAAAFAAQAARAKAPECFVETVAARFVIARGAIIRKRRIVANFAEYFLEFAGG